MTDVLLSIKPKYVEAILEGSKQYEFRKQIFRGLIQPRVLIYSTSPVKRIVGCFYPGEIVEGHPNYLWEQFHDVSGLNEQEFFKYYNGKENGYAIQIDELERFTEPLDPRVIFESFVPPQSFCYVNFSPSADILI